MIIKKLCVLMLTGCLALSGCGKDDSTKKADVTEEKEVKEVDIEKEGETGSFDSMKITYPGKYSIDFYTKTTGHPSGDVDFQTDCDWRTDDGSGGCIISYYVYTDNRIEDDYDNYDSLDEYIIDGKAYKALTGEDELNLLYKVDDSFYVRVCLWHTSQFDASGSAIDVTCTPLYMLENGYFDDVIIMDIIAVD